jgi:ethanolamine ammonia-lyase small subunit
MPADKGDSLSPDFPAALQKIRERTPVRIFVGRAGAAYRTSTQLDLREAHAAARDAVRAELDMESAFGAAFIKQWGLFETCTVARSKNEYLQQPELGRRFDEESRGEVVNRCPQESDVQIAIGDGLSVTAVTAQVPTLLPLLHAGARMRGWSVGRTFIIRHCRVGILNDVGELLQARVAILLVGERPGLATAESLSAYMAYKPRMTHTDADRNLISNIHARGLKPQPAADRILNLADQMMTQEISGIGIRDSLSARQRIVDFDSDDLP